MTRSVGSIDSERQPTVNCGVGPVRGAAIVILSTCLVEGCSVLADFPQPANEAEACDNAVDDDFDSLTDCDDPDCLGRCIERCADGLDNDADGFVDGHDPECWRRSRTAESCATISGSIRSLDRDLEPRSWRQIDACGAPAWRPFGDAPVYTGLSGARGGRVSFDIAMASAAAPALVRLQGGVGPGASEGFLNVQFQPESGRMIRVALTNSRGDSASEVVEERAAVRFDCVLELGTPRLECRAYDAGDSCAGGAEGVLIALEVPNLNWPEDFGLDLYVLGVPESIVVHRVDVERPDRNPCESVVVPQPLPSDAEVFFDVSTSPSTTCFLVGQPRGGAMMAMLSSSTTDPFADLEVTHRFEPGLGDAVLAWDEDARSYHGFAVVHEQQRAVRLVEIESPDCHSWTTSPADVPQLLAERLALPGLGGFLYGYSISANRRAAEEASHTLLVRGLPGSEGRPAALIRLDGRGRTLSEFDVVDEVPLSTTFTRFDGPDYSASLIGNEIVWVGPTFSLGRVGMDVVEDASLVGPGEGVRSRQLGETTFPMLSPSGNPATFDALGVRQAVLHSERVSLFGATFAGQSRLDFRLYYSAVACPSCDPELV